MCHMIRLRRVMLGLVEICRGVTLNDSFNRENFGTIGFGELKLLRHILCAFDRFAIVMRMYVFSEGLGARSVDTRAVLSRGRQGAFCNVA